MQFLNANNAGTLLAAPLGTTDTTGLLAPGTGASFPMPTPTESYYVATLSNGLIKEIVWITAVSGDAITLLRAQEGTVALAWPTGSLFENLWTAGQIQGLIQAPVGATVGSLLYLSDLGWVSLPAAIVAGRVLVSNGPGQAPGWAVTGPLAATAFVVTGANALIISDATVLIDNAMNGKFLVFTNASPVTVTVPPGLDAGFGFPFTQDGAGLVTFVGGSGVTLTAFADGLTTLGQGAQGALFYKGTIDSYSLGGYLA